MLGGLSTPALAKWLPFLQSASATAISAIGRLLGLESTLIFPFQKVMTYPYIHVRPGHGLFQRPLAVSIEAGVKPCLVKGL
jgi:hypothetical protein